MSRSNFLFALYKPIIAFPLVTFIMFWVSYMCQHEAHESNENRNYSFEKSLKILRGIISANDFVVWKAKHTATIGSWDKVCMSNNFEKKSHLPKMVCWNG